MSALFALQKAVLSAGSVTALAARIGEGVKRQNVEHWIKSGRVPSEHCAAVEAASGGQVRRWHLRPDDWHRIWPELIGADGAPAVPQPSNDTEQQAAA